MKPEQYLDKLKTKVNNDVDKNIQRLEEKKHWYRYEKYPEDFYGCRYDMYWDKCDEEIEQWKLLRDTLDGCRVSIPEKEQIQQKVRFCQKQIQKFSDKGYIMDDYTGMLLKDLMENLQKIMELTYDI